MNTICKQQSITIAISTDLHFLARSLYEKESSYARISRQARSAEQLLDGLLEEVIKQKADILLLTGDLASNGERESHIELIQKLNLLKKVGISVLVLPGNHDIRHQKAAEYIHGEQYPTDSIGEKEFQSMYASYGYDQAFEKDENSLSYIVALSKKIWLVCIDNCCRVNERPQKYGELKEETLAWLEMNLRKANKEDVTVLVAAHYNLAYHNHLFREGFTMRNGKQIAHLLKRYNVNVYVSGHMHMQHISEEHGVRDIVTSSLLTYPHQFGLLKIKNGRQFEYNTRKIPLSNFENAALRKFYYESMMIQVSKELEKLSCVDRNIQQMMAFFASTMNYHYFSGTFYKIASEARQTKEWRMWERYGKDIFFYQYMQSMFEDERYNHNHDIGNL